MVQVRYADECFVLTATYTDNYYHNPDIVDGQTLMLRFELKHLGEFGYATDVARLSRSASSSRAADLDGRRSAASRLGVRRPREPRAAARHGARHGSCR